MGSAQCNTYQQIQEFINLSVNHNNSSSGNDNEVKHL